MTKRAINVDAIKRAGPYSQMIAAGGFVYLSGIIPLVPGSTDVVTETIEAQAERVMQNMVLILGEAGLTLAEVVKTTIFLTDMGDYAAVNDVYANYFGETPPARSAVAVSALPKGVNLEIEAIALQS